MKKHLLTLIFFSLVLFSCKEDPEVFDDEPAIRRAVIAMEGESPGGISTVGVYNINELTLDNNVYQKQNVNQMGFGLSDMLIDEEAGLAFFLLAGSEKIVVTDLETHELVKSIGDLSGLQKIEKVASGLYYVTSLDVGGVMILRGDNFSFKGKSIETSQFPGDMTIFEDFAFVVNNGGNGSIDSTVSIIRTSADTIIDTIQVGENPNSLAVDKYNRLWVLCDGEYNEQNPIIDGSASIFRYHLDSMKTAIDSGWSIEPDTFWYFQNNLLRPHNLILDDEGEQIFYIGDLPVGKLYSMSYDARRTSEIPLLSDDFYALGFDDIDRNFYCLRANGADYNDNGFVDIYSTNVSLIHSFQIGVRPSYIEFR